MERLKSIAITFLFLVPAIAGCLGNEGVDSLSADGCAKSYRPSFSTCFDGELGATYRSPAGVAAIHPGRVA